jgi:hypothetical protein
MKAPNLLALTAAALFTTAGLLAINSNVKAAPVSEINGAKVINLAPIEVRPTAEDLRAAALLADASIASFAVSAAADSRASLLGAQLAMPYYSFGTTLGRISKE